MKKILLISLLFLIGCANTGQRYYYIEQTFYKDGSLKTHEECKSKAYHFNAFANKSVDEITSSASMADVSVTASKYNSEIDSEAIGKTTSGAGTVVGVATRTAMTGA